MSRFLRYEQCPRCAEYGGDTAGDNLAIYSDGGSHCFACGRHRGGNAGAPRLQGLVDAPKSVLPIDFTREVPVRAWAWLLQYGLSWKYWQPFCGWSEKDSRLVFTVGNPVAFSTGRLITTDTAGNQMEGRIGSSRKWFHYGDAHKHPHLFVPTTSGEEVYGSSSTVLVEDLISAHKVGQVATCLPLFGTSVFPSSIPLLRRLAKPILMWLDKDQEKHAVRRAANLALVSGLPVRYVFTAEDPKKQSLDKIKEIVYNDI